MNANTQVHQFLNQILSIINNATQSCFSQVSNNQIIDIECDDTLIKTYPANQSYCSGNITISGLDMSQYAHVDTNCVQNITSTDNSSISNNLTSKQLDDLMKKGSDEMIKNLNVPDSKKSTVVNLCQNLISTVTQVFKQECFSQVVNNQAILIKNHAQGNITIVNDKLLQDTTAITNCTMKVTIVNKALNDLIVSLGGTPENNTDDNNNNNNGGDNNNNDPNKPEPLPVISENTKENIKNYGFYGVILIYLILLLLTSKFNIKKDINTLLILVFLTLTYTLINYMTMMAWPFDEDYIQYNKNIRNTCIVLWVICIILLVISMIYHINTSQQQ